MRWNHRIKTRAPLSLGMLACQTLLCQTLLCQTLLGQAPEEVRPIATLRCYSSEAKLLELLQVESQRQGPEARSHTSPDSLAPSYYFEFYWVDTSGPMLVKPKLGLRRPVQVVRHHDALEFNYFANPSYGENFEYRLATGEFIYTQIFRSFGSAAHFYVGKGRCEVIDRATKEHKKD